MYLYKNLGLFHGRYLLLIKWKDFAKQYKEVKPYVDEFENCKKAIKALMPDDCYRASGSGVVVTRNKKNILTIKEETK